MVFSSSCFRAVFAVGPRSPMNLAMVALGHFASTGLGTTSSARLATTFPAAAGKRNSSSSVTAVGSTSLDKAGGAAAA